MRRFNEFSAIWRAPTFNRAFYQDVALRWKGIGLRYLFLIVLATWAIVFGRVTYSLTHYIDTRAAADLKNFPPITLKAGKASSPVPQPYIMKDAAGHPLFVLDTTGKTKSPADVGAKILLTETDLIQVEAGGGIRSTPLAGFPDTTVDAAHLIEWLRDIRNGLFPVGLPVVVLFVVAYRLIAALIFAAIGLVFAAMFNTRLSYGALLRLAVVAMTTDLIVSCILWSIPFSDGCGGWVLGHLVTLAYLAFAVKAAAGVIPPASPVYDMLPTQISPSDNAAPPAGAAPPGESDPLFP